MDQKGKTNWGLFLIVVLIVAGIFWYYQDQRGEMYDQNCFLYMPNPQSEGWRWSVEPREEEYNQFELREFGIEGEEFMDVIGMIEPPIGTNGGVVFDPATLSNPEAAARLYDYLKNNLANVAEGSVITREGFIEGADESTEHYLGVAGGGWLVRWRRANVIGIVYGKEKNSVYFWCYKMDHLILKNRVQ